VSRGQSETVGFILVFALITVSAGTVYVSGFSSLDDARTAEEIDNMERAFDVLDENLHDISRRGAPSRSTELRLGNGDIAFGETTTVTVDATYESNGTAAANASIGTRPIVYRLDGTAIAYASGAVLRSDRGAATMRSRPKWVVSDRRTVVPLLVTTSTPGQRTGMGGDVTVLVRSVRLSRGLPVELDPQGTSINATVTVESSRAGAWGRFLEERGFTPIDDDADDGRVSYWIVTDELYVQRTAVRIAFRR
jgi:hypothetical protein